MSRPLRVGVIGVGSISAEHHLPHWRDCPDAELTAICDTNVNRLREQGAKFSIAHQYEDWRELVARSDLDVVDITTPNQFHAPLALAALEAGKHVLCEKPMATRSADGAKMVATSRRVGRKLMINHHFRFERTAVELAQVARRGGLGEAYHAHCRWYRRRRVPVAPTFLQKSLAEGGPMLDLGVHVVDLALWMMGFPKPVSVSASMGTYLAKREDLGGDWGDWKPADYEVEDFACALFRFDTGATMFVETSYLGFHDKPEEWFARVLGTRSGLHWPEGLIVREESKTPSVTQLVGKQRETPYERSIFAFARAVREDQDVPIPPEETLAVLTMMESAYRSAEAGRELPVEWES